MSIRHLDSFFAPRSVALFGASDRPGSVGATVWRNLRQGGFAGPVWAVNPQRDTVGGEPAYRSTDALPEAPDLAVVCTPPATVPGLIQALGARGTRAVIVLTAGLDATQRQAMLDAARQHLVRIVGPNCLGWLAPHLGLNASFAHVAARPGPLAFVSQSGALVTAMLDWAQGRGVGFSHFVSLGEHADVDFGDMLDMLAHDPDTRAILLYIESIESPRKFMSAARAAARNKPVIVVKAGRSAQGQAAAASHTGALAGSDIVFDAAIRRAGMLRVDTLGELFTAAETLAHFRVAAVQGMPGAGQEEPPGLTLVTNGGGAGVMAADAAAAHDVALAPLGPDLCAALDPGLPANWSRANPVDIIGDAPVARYVHTLEKLLATPATGTLLFMHAPTAIVPSDDIARALVPLLQAPAARQRVLASWLGDAAVRQARQLFQQAGIPCYDTPEEAVRAFAMLQDYRRNQAQLMQAPPAGTSPRAPDLVRVRQALASALAEGRSWLTEPEAKSLLAACGVPVVGTREVAVPAGASPAEAAQAAVQAVRRLQSDPAALPLPWPLALKILAPQITHKSDVGGVALDLPDEAALAAAAQAMWARVQAAQPEAVLSGFTVQPFVRRPRAIELIVGTHTDPLFGPVILFGAGGTAVEVLADRAVALPPLNAPLAAALVQRTRVARLLAGWRDVPPADLPALLGVLQSVSQLLAEVPEIVTLDINPLLADAQGVLALDARVGIRADAPGGAQAFAIRPYPTERVQQLHWQGRRLTLRPIRPEDEAQHLAFLQRLAPEDIRMRVFYSRQHIARSELARLTQIDYEREMALLATAPVPGGEDAGEETLGVVRATTDPDNIGAEFGVLVRSDLKGQGLGRLLMEALIRHQRARGTQRLQATALRANERMLRLARGLGFAVHPDPQEPGTVSLVLPLQPPAEPPAADAVAAADRHRPQAGAPPLHPEHGRPAALAHRPREDRAHGHPQHALVPLQHDVHRQRVAVAQGRPALGRAGQVDVHAHALFLHSQGADLGEGRRLDPAHLALQHPLTAPALDAHGAAGPRPQGVGAEQLGHHLQLPGVAQLQQRRAQRDHGLAGLGHPQHAAGHRGTHDELPRRPGGCVQRTHGRPGLGQLMRGDALALLRQLQFLLRRLRRQPVGIHPAWGDKALLRQGLAAGLLVAGAFQRDACRGGARGGALHPHLGDLHPGALLGQGALVLHRRQHGRQSGQGVARGHGVPLAQGDAGQPARQRRGDDIALVQPGTALLLQRQLEHAGVGLRRLHLQRSRREGPGQQRQQGGAGGHQGQELAT
jgi:acetyltransferase